MENVLKNWIKYVSGQDLDKVVDMYCKMVFCLAPSLTLLEKEKDIEDCLNFF